MKRAFFFTNVKIFCAALLPLPVFASLSDDRVSKNFEAEQMAGQFISRALEGVENENTTSYLRCFHLGGALAGAQFFKLAKGGQYVPAVLEASPSLRGLMAEELYELSVTAATKFCALNATALVAAATGADWSEVATNVIEFNYSHRSPYDQELLQIRDMVDDNLEYDTNAAGNFPKTLELCSEMGAVDFFQYNAFSFGDSSRNYHVGTKKIPLDKFRHNYRYRRNGCLSPKQMPLP